mmetsp:Transcript_15311/g.43417  ORF Transcript_15311/g.43417 Transcript_15311/m.43417 type:complete len:200 (-) Transcript_15311:119-718(-)
MFRTAQSAVARSTSSASSRSPRAGGTVPAAARAPAAPGRRRRSCCPTWQLALLDRRRRSKHTSAPSATPAASPATASPAAAAAAAARAGAGVASPMSAYPSRCTSRPACRCAGPRAAYARSMAWRQARFWPRRSVMTPQASSRVGSRRPPKKQPWRARPLGSSASTASSASATSAAQLGFSSPRRSALRTASHTSSASP